MTKQELVQQMTETPSQSSVMNMGAFSNAGQFQMALQASEMFAKSNMIPQTFRGDAGSCFIAVNTALRFRLDPLMVMQNLYVVQGKPQWSGQFAIALINASPKFETTWFENKNGKDYTAGVRMCAKEKSTGNTVYGPWVTPEIVKAERWGNKWNTIPELMYKYRAGAFFARTSCPEVLVGLQVEGEAEDVALAEAREEARRGQGFVQGESVEKLPAVPKVPDAVTVDAVPDDEQDKQGLIAEICERLQCSVAELDEFYRTVSKGKVAGLDACPVSILERSLKNIDRMRTEFANMKAAAVEGGDLL